MVLKNTDLADFSHVLRTGVSGNGRGDDDGAGSSSSSSISISTGSKLTKKDEQKAQQLAATLSAVLTATGDGGGGSGGGGGSKPLSSAMEAAELAVKSKEADALAEQAEATKAGALKSLAVCSEAPQELRDKSFEKWAESLGL